MKGIMQMFLLFAVVVAVALATEDETSNNQDIANEDSFENELRSANFDDGDDDDLTEQDANEILAELAKKRDVDDDGEVRTVKRGWRIRLRRVWRRNKARIIAYGAKAILGKKR